MAGTLPVGAWAWNERWLYPDQLRDLPDKPWQHHTQPSQQPLRPLSGAQTARATVGRTQQQQQAHPVGQQRLKHTMQRSFQQEQQQQQQQYHQQQQHGELSERLERTVQAPPSQASSYTQEPLTERSSHGSFSAAASSSSRGGSGYGSALVPLVSPATGGVLLGEASNNPQAHLHLSLPPSQPRRYRDGTFARMTSESCYSYRHPAAYAHELGTALHLPVGPESLRVTSDLVPQLLVPGSRPPPRARGTKDARAAPPPCRPEQYSFRLWSRVNTSHCVVPYETESQRAFANAALEGADPLDKQHFMRVERKEYKEALAKAKFQQLIRGDRK